MKNENKEIPPALAAEEAKERRDRNIWLEILRFVVVGVIATLVDLLVRLLIQWAIGKSLTSGDAITAISTACGFLVSTVVNYLLSLLWVFKNVKDEKKARSKLYMLYFVILSAVGLLIGVGLMVLGRFVVQTSFGISITNATPMGLFAIFIGKATGETWAYLVCFVLQTCVTMVYNYTSRKFILFRAPKKDEKEA
ncbi:MAG: GtrA family protein [Bacilli bacterium]|jgi:putative flippase GtrA|nr:GtrA family protein [Bacilli bacterium]